MRKFWRAANLLRPDPAPSRLLKSPYATTLEKAIFPKSRRVVNYGSPLRPMEKPQPGSSLFPNAKSWRWNREGKDILGIVGYTNDFYQNNIDWGHGGVGVTVSLQDYDSGFSGVYARVNSLVAKSCGLKIEVNGEYLVPEDGSRYNALTWGIHPGSNLYIASESSDSVKVYDINKKTVSDNFPLETEPHSLSAGRKLLAIGAQSSTLLIDQRVGKVQERLAESMQRKVCGVRLSTDEKHLVAGDNGDTFRWWDLRSLRYPMIEYKFRAAVKAMAFSPGRTDLHVAVGTGTNDKRLALFSKNSTTPRILTEKAGQLSGLIWTESGAVVGSDRFGRRVIAYDVQEGSKIGEIQLPTCPLALVKNRCKPEFSIPCSDQTLRTFELPACERKKNSADRAKSSETRFTTIR